MCPRHSTFTRVQRLSCGFAFIMSSMLVNIMFFGVHMSLVHEDLLYERIRIGLDDLIIGLQCALITVPINMLIVLIFRNAGPRDTILGERAAINYESRQSDVHAKGDFEDTAKDDDDDDDDDDSDDDDNYTSNNDKGWEIKDKDDDSDSDDESDVNVIPPVRLPSWFIYIGWALTISTCVLSSIIVLKYGLSYGYNRSVAWLASFVASATTNIGIMQPLKVAVIAVVMTFLFRSPVKPVTDFTYLIMYGRLLLYFIDTSYLVETEVLSCSNLGEGCLYPNKTNSFTGKIISKLGLGLHCIRLQSCKQGHCTLFI